MKSKALLKFTTKATKIAHRGKLVLQKKSPEILLGVGIVAFVGTVVLACKATLKADDILEQHEYNMKKIEDAKQIAEKDRDAYDYDEDLYHHDILFQRLKTMGEFVKLYAPAAAVGAISVTCILTSRNILNKRYLAAVSAYNALSEVFQTYRKRVVDEYGEKLDQHFRYGTTYSTVTETDVDENGKKIKKKVDVEETPKQKGSDDCVFFDESNPNWDKNPKFNLMFLRAQQNYLNDRLHSVGHVFMNEVYDALGFPHTQTGALIGWVDGGSYDDGFIDFGLYDQHKENVRRFVNGEDNIILLEFNHQGIIWDKI